MLAAFAAGVAESHDDGADFCVKELCVRDEHQRQGLGAAMLAELQRVLAANRVQRLYMLTPSEGPAADFCRKNGFCTNGEAIMVRKPLPHKD
jgi:GNAT superfamily N-acetyltransferase